MLLSTTILPGDQTHLISDDYGKPVTPNTLERDIRLARESGTVDLPETFTFHDLRHASAKTTLDVYGHL